MQSLLARLRRLAPYFHGSRAGLAATALGALLMAATEPMLAEFLRQLLDRGFKDQQFPLWAVPAAILGLFALRSLASFVSQYGLAWASNRAVLKLRATMFERLMQAQPALFAQQTASGLTNALVYEVQAGVTLLTQALLGAVRSALLVVALLGYLLTLNWQLTLFVGVLFPALAFTMRRLGQRLHRVTKEGLQATDDLAYVVEENTQAWRMVRVHGAQADQAQRFARHSAALRQMLMKGAVASGVMTPLTQMLAALALSAVITLALWQARGGAATVGTFIAFVSALLMLVAPLKGLSDVAAPVARGLAGVERGLDLAEQTPVQTGGRHKPEAGRARGEIAFEAVHLRYGGDGRAALQDFSLKVAAGETVALVGPSGAGKTSAVNLLPRFVEPTAGQVLLDGVALAQWDLPSLYRQFALVSQEVVLFNASFAANVALGDAQPQRERVAQALKAAHLDGFVASLPLGMDTLIGHNGGELSGGQRQRLAIARAVYKDAPVLLLDEATSALDSESEHVVQTALAQLMQGRTTLVVAHRLSTIEHAHRVVAMDAGRVVEQGPPAELLAQGGLYARLHAMQFKA